MRTKARRGNLQGVGDPVAPSLWFFPVGANDGLLDGLDGVCFSQVEVQYQARAEQTGLSFFRATRPHGRTVDRAAVIGLLLRPTNWFLVPKQAVSFLPISRLVVRFVALKAISSRTPSFSMEMERMAGARFFRGFPGVGKS